MRGAGRGRLVGAEHAVAGSWPWAGETGAARLRALAALPDGVVVLVDGLVASAVPDLVPASARLRLVVLVHMPLGCDAGDGAPASGSAPCCAAAAAVVTTSEWSRRWLLTAYGLDPARVHVAQPGVDAAEPAAGSADGGEPALRRRR